MLRIKQTPKPLTSITNYTTKFVSTPIYKINKENKKVLQHIAPKIIGNLRTKTDSDLLKLMLKLKNYKNNLKN